MLASLQNVLETFTYTQFEPANLANFPRTQYDEQLRRYIEAERWFTGAALSEETQKAGEQVDLYPMRVNPFIGTVMKHAAVLFGEIEDDARPLVVPKMIPDKDNQKEMAVQAEDIFNFIWYENNGRALMLENGIMSQIYGGCFFKITYTPWDESRVYPIKIENPNPKTVVATSEDGFTLLEAWVVKQIPRIEATTWGYVGDDERVWLVEYWNKDVYSITIDGKPATKQVGNERIPLSGKNVFGVVPIVYIPHLRIGAFMGINAFDHLKGLVKELNLRFADYGDAVNDDSHSITALKNVTGTPKLRRIAPWLTVVDIGSATNMTAHEPDPDLWEVRNQKASAAMSDLLDQIYDQYRRDSFVPAVADGEDEGSQRSGLTLAMRFWPLTSHANAERIFWTSGLNSFYRVLLKMLSVLKVNGITDEHRKMRLKQQWHSMLPRDREADVQEWVSRAGADIGSPWHLISLAGDVEDIDEEVQRMLDYKEKVLELEKKYAPEPSFGAPSSQSPSANRPQKQENKKS